MLVLDRGVPIVAAILVYSLQKAGTASSLCLLTDSPASAFWLLPVVGETQEVEGVRLRPFEPRPSEVDKPGLFLVEFKTKLHVSVQVG